MINIHRQFNRNCAVKCSTDQIWDHITTLVNLDALEDLVCLGHKGLSQTNGIT
jgi:hypothetical protein